MEVQQDYKRMPPYSSEVIKKEGEEKKDSRCCYHFWHWFFQIGVWAFLIASIILVYFDNSIYIGTFIGFGLFYLIYIILELCSPTRTFLKNKNIKEGLKEILIKYITTAPEIKFYGDSYHYETEIETRDDGSISSREIHVTTHEETYRLPFYSARDVSCLFNLNSEKEDVKKKCYIKLELSEEINLADTISYLDWENDKRAFDERNEHLDEKYSFSETRSIPGMVRHNLIKLGDSDPCIATPCAFLLFVFLTFGEFYKSYVNSLCITKKFKIRKLVSTRYDLSQPICNEKYFKFNPQINLINDTYIIEPQDFNHLNNSHQPKLTTQEEIEEAMKYQNKPGVILDILGVDNDAEPIKEIKDIKKNEVIKEDVNSGIIIQMVEKNMEEEP